MSLGLIPVAHIFCNKITSDYLLIALLIPQVILNIQLDAILLTLFDISVYYIKYTPASYILPFYCSVVILKTKCFKT